MVALPLTPQVKPYHERRDDEPRCRFPEKVATEALLQGALKLFMVQARTPKRAKEAQPPARRPGRQWRKTRTAVIVIEAYDFRGRDAKAEAKRDNAPGRRSCDHVEVVCKRTTTAERFFTLAKKFRGIDAANSASVERQDLERPVSRPWLAPAPGDAAIRAAISEPSPPLLHCTGSTGEAGQSEFQRRSSQGQRPLRAETSKAGSASDESRPRERGAPSNPSLEVRF
jgi:hypothetical protein